MTESEAIEKLKNMRLFMQITGKNSDCKFTEDDYKANEMAIQALEKQVPMKVKNSGERIPFEWYCPACVELLCDDGYKDTYIKYCEHCGQKLDWSGGVDG